MEKFVDRIIETDRKAREIIEKAQQEKQAVLAWLEGLPLTKYTVLVCRFANWADTAPLPCFVIKK